MVACLLDPSAEQGNRGMEGAGARRELVSGLSSSDVGRQQGQPGSSDWAGLRVPH